MKQNELGTNDVVFVCLDEANSDRAGTGEVAVRGACLTSTLTSARLAASARAVFSRPRTKLTCLSSLLLTISLCSKTKIMWIFLIKLQYNFH